MLTVACLSACGSQTITPNTVQISNSDGTNSVSYETYMDEESAKANPVTYYAEQSDFPISIIIYGGAGSAEKYEFTTYGIQKPRDKYDGDIIAYAYIMIEPYPDKIESPATENNEVCDMSDTVDSNVEITVSANDVEAVANDSVDAASSNDDDKRLRDLLEEPTPESLCDPKSIYGQEINEFLTGQWNGDTRMDHIEVDDGTIYAVTRDLYMRLYIWTKVDPTGEKTQNKFINIDYDGPFDVVGAGLPEEHYSLATDYENGLIEQWSLFKKQDSWQILLAENETIDYVVAMSHHDVRGTVKIVNTGGETYAYDLLVGGKVEKR